MPMVRRGYPTQSPTIQLVSMDQSNPSLEIGHIRRKPGRTKSWSILKRERRSWRVLSQISSNSNVAIEESWGTWELERQSPIEPLEVDTTQPNHWKESIRSLTDMIRDWRVFSIRKAPTTTPIFPSFMDVSLSQLSIPSILWGQLTIYKCQPNTG